MAQGETRLTLKMGDSGNALIVHDAANNSITLINAIDPHDWVVVAIGDNGKLSVSGKGWHQRNPR